MDTVETAPAPCVPNTPSTPLKNRTSSPRVECPGASCDGWRKAKSGVVACSCRAEKYLRSALPTRFHRSRLQDIGRDVQLAVDKWLAKPGDGLFVVGPAGTGKTHLACAIVRWRWEHGRRAIFQRAAEFFATIRESYDQSTSERAVMEPLLTASMLVLDDLGSGSMSDHERRFALELLDRRGNSLLPTVVTSNWSLSEISERMDDRIASRLAAFTSIELRGRDRRVQKGETGGAKSPCGK